MLTHLIRPFLIRRPGVAACLALAAGCGTQTTTDYLGEALLTLQAEVDLSAADRPDDLVPMLAFFDVDESEERLRIQFVEVSVDGKFPSDFTFSVFDPPNPELATKLWDTDGEPPLTQGIVIAVPPDQPHTLELSMADEDAFAVQIEERFWGRVGGVADDLMVFYLPEGARAGSTTAIHLGGPESGFDPGYHLMRFRQSSDAEVSEADACEDRALALAEQRYRDGHEQQNPCRVVDEPDCPEVAYEAWNALLSEALDELTCRFEFFFSPIDTSTTVRMVVDPDARPIFW